MNEGSRRAVVIFEIASAVFCSAAIFIGVWHRPVLGIAGATLAMYLFFLFVNRIPIRKMNLAVAVTDENATRIESIVRPRLAAIGTLTIALFTWMTANAALQTFGVYLATFWIFLVGIVALLISMVAAVRKAG